MVPSPGNLENKHLLDISVSSCRWKYSHSYYFVKKQAICMSSYIFMYINIHIALCISICFNLCLKFIKQLLDLNMEGCYLKISMKKSEAVNVYGLSSDVGWPGF